MPAHLRSPQESGEFAGAAQVNAGTALQQLLCHAQLPGRRRRVQQPDPALVNRVDVPALLQPPDNQLRLSVARGEANLGWQRHGDAGRRLCSVLPD
eukprot:scaffold127404_cov75-Phaeocystis_antarctica.AAC.3